MLIALNRVMSTGERKRILVNPETINYMEDKSEGYGSIVYAFMGTMHVVETTQQIKDKVSSKTQSHGASTE
jgi:hypothetical protein